MSSPLVPSSTDPDVLIDQFVHYMEIFETSATDAECWERKVKLMKEEVEDAEKAMLKVKGRPLTVA